MTITKTIIKNRGTLQEFTADFAPITVIYGPNASGKSLLSNTFRALELGEGLSAGKAEVTFADGSTVNLSDTRQPARGDIVRVFNAIFLRDDVIDVKGNGDGHGPSAIVLGREVIDERRRIEAIERKLESLNHHRDELNRKIDSLRNALSDSQTETGRQIEQVLRTASSIPGFDAKRWSHYNKIKAGSRYDRMLKDGDKDHYTISSAAVASLEQDIKERPSTLPAMPEVSDPNVTHLHNAAVSVCTTRVQYKPLQEAEADPDLRDWLWRGYEYANQADRCGYCHQTVPAERATKLDAYFNNDMVQMLNAIDELTGHIESVASKLSEPVLPETDQIRKADQQAYAGLRARLTSQVKSTKDDLASIKRNLEAKRNRPTDNITLDDPNSKWDLSLVEKISLMLGKHNTVVANILALCDQYESGMIAQVHDKWKDFNDKIDDLTSKVECVDSQMAAEKFKLLKLKRSSESKMIAADELTEMVRNFLGHDEIGFELHEDGLSYLLTRRGEPADDFSEGERTALALMYFLKRLEDNSFDKRNGTIILDDPITSFDEDNLYRAVADIIARTGRKDESHYLNSSKLIIMTHHYGLLERLWMDFRHQRDNGRAKFYEIRCQMSDSGRTSSFIQLTNTPITDYQTAYLDVLVISEGGRSINNPETSIRKFVEGFLMRMAPNMIDQGLPSTFWTFTKDYHDQMSGKVTREDLQLILAIANGGSHASAIPKPASTDAQWSTLKNVGKKTLKLVESTVPSHHRSLTQWARERRKRTA